MRDLLISNGSTSYRSALVLLIITLTILSENCVSFLHSKHTTSPSRNMKMKETNILLSSVTKNADLTPAIDKYVKVPSVSIPEKYVLSAQGPPPNGRDPFSLVADDLQPLSDYVKELVSSENPVLTMAASHFFDQRQGKRFRPTIVALLGRTLASDQSDYKTSTLKRRHIQLGQITEIIHVASLIHDDVLDEADTRRGGASVHTLYTNKVAVLAGDYLLAKASVLLARLHHFQVVEVMASALDALVQGEIMQARAKKEDLINMDYYLRKSYFKTASLIYSACKSCALLSGHEENDMITKSAEEFGHHLGMAFQIIDDILDFTGASASLGKPAQADMSLGLATAPILFASETVKEIRPLIERRFKESGDIQKAVALASSTDCVVRSYQLAEFHAQQAVNALLRLPNCESREALMKLLYLVISRDK